MDCIITVNIGDYLCSNARQSLIAAAHRWGVDYIEVTKSFNKFVNPCYTKLSLFQRLRGYDRVIYFDCDTLIRWDTPNPLEIFTNSSKFYAVKNITPNRFQDDKKREAHFEQDCVIPWWQIIEKREQFGINLEKYNSNFFNSGFFIVSPNQFRDMFDFLVKRIPQEGTPYVKQGRYEQALLNYFVQAFGELELIDETWNYIEPDLSDNRMNAFVYHFTGFNSGFYKQQINKFEWRNHKDVI